VIPSVALLMVAQAVRALRWQYLFAAPTRPPYRPTLDATLLGQALNNLLPARAGEAARVLWLHRHARSSRAEALATVVVERLYDVLALLVLLFVLVPWLPHVTWLRAAAILAVVLAAATAVAVGVLARYGERPLLAVLRPLARLPFLSPERSERAAAAFVRGAASLRDWRLAVTALVLTTASWLVLAASSWVLLLGFGLPHSFLAGTLVTIATGLSLVLPSSPGAVGVFETAALVALKAYGIPKSGALSYALVLHAVNFFPYVAAGLLVLGLSRRRIR
jgi:glycosyltransferase 2 family protein